MARTRQKLINYHSSGKTEITQEILDNLNYGEIAVRHAADQPELIIKTGPSTKAVFIDSNAIDSKIDASQISITGQLEVIDERLDTIESGYAQSAIVDTLVSGAKDSVYSSAVSYTNGQISTVSGTILDTVASAYTTKDEFDTLNNTVTAHTSAIASADTRLSTIESGYAQSAVVNTLINTKISNVYKFKGSVNTYDDLSSITTKENGDVYNVISGNGTTPPGTNYAYVEASGTTPSHWDALGGSIDLSIYVTDDEFNTLSNTVTAHTSAIASADTRLSTIESGYAQSAVVDTLVSGAKDSVYSSAVSYTDGAISDALDTVANDYVTNTEFNNLNDVVTGHTSAIASADTRLTAVENIANSALQGFQLSGTSASTVSGNETTQYGAVANFTSGGNATLDLSALVIDCGDF